MGTYLKSAHITFNLAKGVICGRSQSYIRTIQHGISCGLADANLTLSVKRSVLQLHLVALQYRQISCACRAVCPPARQATSRRPWSRAGGFCCFITSGPGPRI